MSEESRQSLVQRTGMALATVILLAIVNMVASYLTAESSENDAVRINIAGSLRMQSYRIANEYILQQAGSSLSTRAALDQAIDDFEVRLQMPVLADHLHDDGNQTTGAALSLVENGWKQLKPTLLAGDSPVRTVLQLIDRFVADIDVMVKELELQTEGKFRVLRIIQGASLLLTVSLASVMFLNMYKYVVGPLHQLVSMADRLRAGDFSMRLDSAGDDELTLLANAFNDMADSLDDMYRTLEDKVKSKTRHLEETQKMLRFLYDASSRLSEEGDIVSKLERTIEHLRREIDIVGGDIQLHHASPVDPFLIDSNPRGKAWLGRSDNLLVGQQEMKRYGLHHDSRDYGLLNVMPASPDGISPEQHLMLTSLADTIAAALANEARKDQEHRVALMAERAAIARELHDSIAQSLSFTKIQTSRLQGLLAEGAEGEQLDKVLAEIRTGIQSAYAQLRELLTTFRLQIDTPGLQACLSATAAEFEDKGRISVTLQSSVQNYPLTPNEEIHILQIVREALSNVLRHSGADCATIRLGLDQHSGMIEVEVADNGKGFSDPSPSQNHYGQSIMRERAGILGGNIEFTETINGGAQVTLRFTAAHAVSPVIDQQVSDPRDGNSQ